MFPCLEEIHFSCSPIPSHTTHYTYYHIPTSLKPPVHLPTTFRIILLFITIPVKGPVRLWTQLRQFRVAWDLRRPSQSDVTIDRLIGRLDE